MIQLIENITVYIHDKNEFYCQHGAIYKMKPFNYLVILIFIFGNIIFIKLRLYNMYTIYKICK